VIFTKNITEGLNLLSNTFAWADGDLRVGPGDEVLITEMEHHSNIVPWQLLTERTGATLRWFGITDDGLLDLSNLDDLITERTKVVSLTWVSNMLGTINPVRQIADRAHEVGAVVIVDAAQAVPHLPVDVVASGACTELKPWASRRKYVGVLDEQPMPLSFATLCGGMSSSQNARMIAAVMESWPQPAHSVDMAPS
jgi:cysteine sulfinate desulfinase/cysteine desulfurase-like protein